MIKSMTGFATGTAESGVAATTATVKTVNHRFLDLQLRVPPLLAAVEGALRTAVQQRVARGRVEVALNVQMRRPTAAVVELDEAFSARLAAAIDRARELGVIAGTLQPGDLLRFPQALSVREEAASAPDEERAAVKEGALAALNEALAALDVMRRREGELLAADIDERCRSLARLVDAVQAAAVAGEDGLRARLAARIDDLGAGAAVGPEVLAQEIVRFAARSDISEELVRFKAHLVHWHELTAGAEPCGRKLDFLLQEMNREINTMGSKAEGLQVSPIIVEVKAELERLREQVQNIE
jgi:uncharacterized protein (TIGR00255 family)